MYSQVIWAQAFSKPQTLLVRPEFSGLNLVFLIPSRGKLIISEILVLASLDSKAVLAYFSPRRGLAPIINKPHTANDDE